MSAKVKMGRDQNTGEQVALKLIDKSKTNERQLAQLYREVDAMKSLYHPNILNLKYMDMNAVYPKKNGTTRNVMLLVLELAAGGELFDFMMYTGAFQETIARTYFYQLMSALKCCHDHHIYHRDIKPENLLLDSHFQLKVADFGLSSVQERDGVTLQTECGTRSYMAPEVIAGQGYDGSKADIWSAGVVLFIMLAGNPPFQMANRRDWWFNAISLGRHDRFWAAHLRTCPHFPEAAQTLLNRVFVAEPTSRASIEDILQDPWMTADKMSNEELYEELNRRKQRVDTEKAREREAAKAKKAQQARAGAGRTFDTFARNTARSTVDVQAPVLPEDHMAARTAFYTTEQAGDVLDQLQSVLQAVDSSAQTTVKYEQCKLKAALTLPGEAMEFEGENLAVPGAPLTVEATVFRTEEHGPLLVEVQRRQGDMFAFDKLFQDILARLGEAVVIPGNASKSAGIDIIVDEVGADEELLSDDIGML
jgi:serine/threonine protein kinase